MRTGSGRACLLPLRRRSPRRSPRQQRRRRLGTFKCLPPRNAFRPRGRPAFRRSWAQVLGGPLLVQKMCGEALMLIGVRVGAKVREPGRGRQRGAGGRRDGRGDDGCGYGARCRSDGEHAGHELGQHPIRQALVEAAHRQAEVKAAEKPPARRHAVGPSHGEDQRRCKGADQGFTDGPACV